MSTQPRHPDAGNLYRHNWTPAARAEAGYPSETRTQSIARLFRAELHNRDSGNAGVERAAKAERLRLLGKKKH